MFKNPFSFEGRIRRLEYAWSVGIYGSILWIFFLMVIFIAPDPVIVIIAGWLISLPLLWFIIAQGTKRCHDLGRPGTWQLIPFYWFWILFADGDLGPNNYGDNPKGLEWDFGDDEADKGNEAKSSEDVDEDGIIK
jgi:uncharacterized membrane protein YhaH (DUF805 family)